MNSSPSPACVICGHSAPLEYCVTDEKGQLVHEDCYVTKALEKAHEQPRRTWHEIASEITNEQDPVKVVQLAKELNQAMLDEGLVID